jgi:hypothetical protein
LDFILVQIHWNKRRIQCIIFYFKIYLKEITDIIGNYCVETITKLINDMIGKEDILFKYNFQNTTNFDYFGDSFVEALNHSIKNGSLSVNSRMDMCTSAFTQLKARMTENITHFNFCNNKFIMPENVVTITMHIRVTTIR